jgi:hypothetical protein
MGLIALVVYRDTAEAAHSRRFRCRWLVTLGSSGTAVIVSFVFGFLEYGIGLNGRMGTRAGNTVGQNRSNPVQGEAAVHAIGEKIAVNALPTRAFHQVTNIKIKAMSVLICHGRYRFSW